MSQPSVWHKLIGGITAAIMRRDKQKRPLKGADLLISPATTPPQLPLTISFPEIIKPLPDLWDVNVPLQIEIEALPEYNGPVSLELLAGNQGRVDIQLRNGLAFVTYVFSEKGKFELHLIEPTQNQSLSSRTIRIVDYTEEVNYHSCQLLERLVERDRALNHYMTPRELLKNGLEGLLLRDGSLDLFIEIVELATYCQQEISRTEYRQFYLSYLEANKYLNKLS